VRAERLLRSGQPLTSAEANIVAYADPCRLENARDRLQPILASFEAVAETERGSLR